LIAGKGPSALVTDLQPEVDHLTDVEDLGLAFFDRRPSGNLLRQQHPQALAISIAVVLTEAPARR